MFIEKYVRLLALNPFRQKLLELAHIHGKLAYSIAELIRRHLILVQKPSELRFIEAYFLKITFLGALFVENFTHGLVAFIELFQ